MTKYVSLEHHGGSDVKSVAKLVCSPARVNEFDGWDTEYVKMTCEVLEPNSPTEILGATVGNDNEIKAAALDKCNKVASKLSSIVALHHAPSELVLTRRCGDVGNFTYWLRCYGDIIGTSPSDSFDKGLRSTVEETLGGPLPDTAWWQCGIGAERGGLGLRSARDIALPAFIASRVDSRPMVTKMFDHIEAAGLGLKADLIAEYDRRTTAAINSLCADLPVEVHEQVRDTVKDGVTAAAGRWIRISLEHNSVTIEGNESEERGDTSSSRLAGSLAAGFVADAGSEDPENPGYKRGSKLQRHLT